MKVSIYQLFYSYFWHNGVKSEDKLSENDDSRRQYMQLNLFCLKRKPKSIGSFRICKLLIQLVYMETCVYAVSSLTQI